MLLPSTNPAPATSQKQMGRECRDCDLLLEKAMGAIICHMKLAANMDIAEVIGNQQSIVELRPILEQARRTRESAIADYKAHLCNDRHK